MAAGRATAVASARSGNWKRESKNHHLSTWPVQTEEAFFLFRRVQFREPSARWLLAGHVPNRRRGTAMAMLPARRERSSEHFLHGPWEEQVGSKSNEARARDSGLPSTTFAAGTEQKRRGHAQPHVAAVRSGIPDGDAEAFRPMNGADAVGIRKPARVGFHRFCGYPSKQFFFLFLFLYCAQQHKDLSLHAGDAGTALLQPSKLNFSMVFRLCPKIIYLLHR